VRTKKELLALPIYELTLPEFGWVYPDLLCFDHFHAVEAAIKAGKAVPPKVRATYPSLKGKARAK
jgi:hypothetical protein